MKRIVRFIISCCLGLLVPAFIFPWLVRALVPVKKAMPPVTFTPAADSARKATSQTPTSTLETKPGTP